MRRKANSRITRQTGRAAQVLRVVIALMLTAAAGATTAQGPAPAAPVQTLANSTLTPLRLHIVGPIDPSGTVTRFQWPAIHFEARFRGGEVYLGALTGRSRFRIRIDGRPHGILQGPSPGHWLRGLGPGAHRIRLMRVDEDRDGVAGFAGMFVANTADALAPPRSRARQILFIGDSFQAGFGLTSGKQGCDEDEIWATTDTSLTYTALLADAFDADFETLAYSCMGLIRNCVWRRTTPTMMDMAGRALFDDPAPAVRQGVWRPQLIVVALGGNDFADPVDGNESWKDMDAVRRSFVAGTVRFATRLRREHPQAFILLLDYADANTAALHAQALALLKAGGEARVGVFTAHGPFAVTGCLEHLDAADNRKIAAELAAWVKRAKLF